jgi:hypothetical protein
VIPLDLHNYINYYNSSITTEINALHQVTNVFTKALPKDKIYKFRDDVGISPNDHYGGEMLG